MELKREDKNSAGTPVAGGAPPPPFVLSQPAAGQWVITFSGPLNTHSAPELIFRLRSEFKRRPMDSLTVHLADVDDFDDYGAMVLVMLRQWVESQDGRFERVDPGRKSEKILSLIGFDNRNEALGLRRSSSAGLVSGIGNAVLSLFSELRFMTAFVGAFFMAAVAVLKNPRSLRLGDVVTNMEKTGVRALPIVGLISFLLGLVMAFMSSIQLQQFGANIYVASLVALAMVSELGPIMTAIVVAGRSGSAFAAELGTMKISEEIDALTTMGFDPIQFLVLPKVIAAVLVIPLLTLFADLFAIAGGLFVGVLLLDLTVSSYLDRTLDALSVFEVVWGLGKSVVFATTIAMVGCLRGIQTRGGADAVGNAATSAVVTSIFLIILLDSIFAVARSYWR